MDIPEPAKVPGSTLAAERDAYGVTREDLAEKMGRHRNTLRAWEADGSEVDAIRAAKYRKALHELVAEAVA